MIGFVSGGARSGKSEVAERMAMAVAARTRGQLYYVATSPSLCHPSNDDAYKERIRRHQQRRDDSWCTIEERYHLERVFGTLRPTDVALVDCVTVWCSQLLFDLQLDRQAIRQKVARSIQLIQHRGAAVVFVSNDVNEELPAESDTVQQYMQTLQMIHQQLTAVADRITQVIAGLNVDWRSEKR